MQITFIDAQSNVGQFFTFMRSLASPFEKQIGNFLGVGFVLFFFPPRVLVSGLGLKIGLIWIWFLLSGTGISS
jgi:hypothetical protein